MSQTTTLAALRQPETSPAIAVGFDTVAGFEALQRMAKMFAKSPITPDQFRKPYVTKKVKQRDVELKTKLSGIAP